MTKFSLNNGTSIPALGLGTWQSTGNDVKNAVKHALKIGYRHIDTAAVYGNEKEVGEAIAESGINREELFVTTKIWNDISTKSEATAAIETSLNTLKTDYVDLLLVHWPGEYDRNSAVYSAMEDAYQDGLARAIGISNFNIHHLDALLKSNKTTPVVNQVECHVSLQNHRLQRYCKEKGILLEAYAPMKSWKVNEIVEDKTLNEIGSEYGKTATQVALRWLIQRGIVVLPKSVTPSRIEQNFDVFDFNLTEEQMATIRLMNKGEKMFIEPDNIDLGFPVR